MEVLPSAQPRPTRPTLPAPPLVAAAVVLVGLAIAYYPNIANLIGRWSDDPNYSHGFLVVPIALAILWQRRDELDLAKLRPSWVGWVALAALLAARFWLFERNEQWLETATVVPAVAALAIAFGGWPLLRWALPAVGFLILMLPLPPSINLILAGPLQTLATLGSTTLLQAMGLPVVARGNVILIGSEELEVAQACNGLSMLLSFVTLITAMVILLSRSRPLWERVVLLLSTIPIALIANILRIAGTAWAYHRLGAERGEKLAHDVAGWAMMPIALVLVLIELKVLSWLIVADEDDPKRLVIPVSPTGPVPPLKKKPAGGGGPAGSGGGTPADWSE